jgi:hypothetical protein
MTPKPKEKTDRRSKIPGNLAPDDMRDGEDIRELENPLGIVISYIHASLYETYSEFDRDAITSRKYHRMFSALAVFFGTLAIILSIFQVFLRAYGDPAGFLNNPGLAYFEKGAFMTALLSVGIALGSRLLRNWLKKRSMAEQCRTLKFRALIHPFLAFSSDQAWTDRFTRWKTGFDAQVLLLKKKECLTLEEILVADKMNAPPHDTSGNPLNIPYLEMLVEYYQKKRISTQIGYFASRARSFGTANRNTERIPQYCFLGGVVFAGVQFGIELFNAPLLTIFFEADLKTIQAVTLLITLVLPSFGVAFRTWRSSIEVARSASLYTAKCRALKQFELRLSEERARTTVRWEEILKILWECENFFEIENREWLRIMHDAEWFL